MLTAHLRRAGELFASERDRWPLWIPVFIGAGVTIYFALPVEPPVWLGGALAASTLAGFGVLRRRTQWAVPLLGASLLAAGLAVAQTRAHLVAQPVLERDYGPATIAGHVIKVESHARGQRVILEGVMLRELASNRETPGRVRVVLRRGDQIAVGDRIEVFGRLSPPRPPVAPGAYDFSRRAWFEGLGATGFALGFAQRNRAVPTGGYDRTIRIALAALRQSVSERVRAALPGESGAIAAALITGDRSAISEPTLVAMRNSGLAHLLAISGLHLGLVAAILFFGARSILAFSEYLTLHHPIKKWAAALAIAGSFAYLLLAGMTIPTQRAFVMTVLVMLAIVFDREAISMRLVAWAAVVILLTTPESLLTASFQMSFAAVVALVAFYESRRVRIRELAATARALTGGRILLYIGGVAATTLIASIATGLIGLHHFGRIAVYGLPANLLAVPMTALWVMPWAVVAAILMPLGLESWPLWAMGWGIDAVLAVARTVASWPGAVRLVPAMSGIGLGLVAAGGLWLGLWRKPWRYAGILGILGGLATVPLTARPDILVADSGRLMAVRLADGTLSLSDGRRERYAARLWLESNGQEEGPLWSRSGATSDGRLMCDPLGCIYRVDGHRVALVRDGRALDDDCRIATILISAVPVRRGCSGPRLIIDRFDMWRHGAHALWLDTGEVRVRTVNGSQCQRPWTPRRGYD